MTSSLLAMLSVFIGLTGHCWAQTGSALVEQSLQRHAPPNDVFEEHVLVMTDRLGHYSLRSTRFYARRDEKTSRQLYVIESPAELKGATVRIDRDADAGTRRGPAPSTPLFGTNLLVADLEGEQSGNFRYSREGDLALERIPHFVIRAEPADASIVRTSSYHDRRIYMRKDNLFVSRIDYFDGKGRMARRLAMRDPRPDALGIWRATMLLMEDFRDGRRTLLKVERRVHSPDYIPPGVFDWPRGWQ